MRRGFCLVITIIFVLNSGADEKEVTNPYLSLLVEDYAISKAHDFQIIDWDDSLTFSWGKEKVMMSFSSIQRNTNVVIFDSNSGLLFDTFILDYEIMPYYIGGIFQTKLRGYETLVIHHYLLGATGWTASLHIMHLIIKTDSGYRYQELSSFFSSIESFVDLNEDDIAEFVCVRLILDEDGNFAVPVIFSFSETGEFRKSTSGFRSNPVRLDRFKGLIPITWEDVSESVKGAFEFSEPKAYRHRKN